jgi:hypothetical protein
VSAMLSEAAFGRPLASQKNMIMAEGAKLRLVFVGCVPKVGRIGVLGLEFGKRLDNQLNVRKMQEQSILKFPIQLPQFQEAKVTSVPT